MDDGHVPDIYSDDYYPYQYTDREDVILDAWIRFPY